MFACIPKQLKQLEIYMEGTDVMDVDFEQVLVIL